MKDVKKLYEEYCHREKQIHSDREKLEQFRDKAAEADRAGKPGRYLKEIEEWKERGASGEKVLAQIGVEHREAVSVFNNDEIKRLKKFVAVSQSKVAENLKNVEYYMQQLAMLKEQNSGIEKTIADKQKETANLEQFETEKFHELKITLEELKKMLKDPMSIINHADLRKLIQEWGSKSMELGDVGFLKFAVSDRHEGQIIEGILYYDRNGTILKTTWAKFQLAVNGEIRKNRTLPLIMPSEIRHELEEKALVS